MHILKFSKIMYFRITDCSVHLFVSEYLMFGLFMHNFIFANILCIAVKTEVQRSNGGYLSSHFLCNQTLSQKYFHRTVMHFLCFFLVFSRIKQTCPHLWHAPHAKMACFARLGVAYKRIKKKNVFCTDRNSQ